MFHPFRTIARFITLTFIIALLLYSHHAAFKAGMAAGENPMTNTLAQFMGLGSSSSCASPLKEKKFYFF
ncbi:hypothetical protein [Calothrix sp. 336/3]|uniref:hypothetical protein n=1 Tax=Calothrix sp. 336/3 TaxID=1337936 RepID=UPI00118731F0|nr:hypothetical protein [Calothrix sp. 336/3]